MQNESRPGAHHGSRTNELDADYAARTATSDSDGRDEAEVLSGAPSMRRGVDTRTPNALHTAADETFGDTDLYVDEAAREDGTGKT